MLTLPVIVLGFVIAMLFGTLYHGIRGGGGWRLLFFLGLSLLGFTVGHFLGAGLGWSFLLVGSLNLGMAVIGCVLFLVIGDWLIRL